MTERKQFRAIKGVRDILPPESALWNRFEQTVREVFATYGYGEIRLPIFEQTELFARSIGTDTDVVSKEMYSFIAYGSPRIYSLAQAITSWPDPLRDDSEFEPYKRYVRAFLQELENASAQG